MDSSFVAWLDGSPLAYEQAGGKMASLSELTALGLEVPPSFVVLAHAFSQFAAHHGISSRIERFARRFAPGVRARAESEADGLAAEAREIRSAIRNSEMMPQLVAELVEAYERIASAPEAPHRAVSVRSSAILEDHAERSCAGMYDTFLMIDDAFLVCDMVKLCWASLFSERSVWYLANREVRADDPALWRMAVGVQRMVDARSAGVAMTVNPTTGDRSKIHIEATWGLGETLVQGFVDPDSFTLDKVTLECISRKLGGKRERLVCSVQTGSVERCDVEDALRNIFCLSDADLEHIGRAAKLIETHYKTPQDVEWAISGQGDAAVLHVLQARPQTALAIQTEPTSARRSADSAVDYVIGLFK